MINFVNISRLVFFSNRNSFSFVLSRIIFSTGIHFLFRFLFFSRPFFVFGLFIVQAIYILVFDLFAKHLGLIINNGPFAKILFVGGQFTFLLRHLYEFVFCFLLSFNSNSIVFSYFFHASYYVITKYFSSDKSNLWKLTIKTNNEADNKKLFQLCFERCYAIWTGDSFLQNFLQNIWHKLNEIHSIFIKETQKLTDIQNHYHGNFIQRISETVPKTNRREIYFNIIINEIVSHLISLEARTFSM